MFLVSYDDGKCLGPRDYRAGSIAGIRIKITLAHARE
jgi:hypothetical protein